MQKTKKQGALNLKPASELIELTTNSKKNVIVGNDTNKAAPAEAVNMAADFDDAFGSDEDDVQPAKKAEVTKAAEVAAPADAVNMAADFDDAFGSD